MMMLTDPPRHAKLRQIVNKGFTPRSLAPREPAVRALCREIVDSVAARGSCDFVVDVAARLPTAVICQMMGIPEAFWDHVIGLTNRLFGSSDPEYQEGGSVEQTARAVQVELFMFFGTLIEERRKRPGADLVSAILQGEVEGERLDDMEVLFNCILFLVAGQETTRNAISGGILELIRSPEERARLAREPEIMPNAVEEILRWSTPVAHVMRTATRDLEIGGRKVKEGERVVAWLASANRDERVFADPYRFDLARSPNDHLAFGFAEHFCLGANLARLEIRAMVEEVLSRLHGLELAGEPVRLRSNFAAGIKHMPIRFQPSPSPAGSVSIANHS
jgi:cytochrome P450